MQKTADISKLDIDWQVQRIKLKALIFTDKLKQAENYLRTHANRADKERVLNYLEGLSFGYVAGSANRQACLNLLEDLQDFRVTSENSYGEDFSKFDPKTLTQLLRDLVARAIKWLKKGYRQKELLTYIKRLATHLQDTATLTKLNFYEQESYNIPNTHKFFF